MSVARLTALRGSSRLSDLPLQPLCPWVDTPLEARRHNGAATGKWGNDGNERSERAKNFGSWHA